MTVTLRAGGARAVVHPARGGRLGQLDLGHGPLLRGPGDADHWAHWGSYVLAPWSNRIPGGHLRFGDLAADLAPNWPDGSAIHGLVADVPWTVDAAAGAEVSLSTEVASPPYVLRCEQRYALTDGELHHRVSVRNEGDRAVPAGIGIHPWFRAGPVRVPAEAVWPGEPLPNGPAVRVGPGEDLRVATVPGPMDRCYTALTETFVEVSGLQLEWTGPITQVVVFTGHPGWIAVEPVTMANDGFGLARRGVAGHGVRVLAPGEALRVAYRYRSAAPAG